MTIARLHAFKGERFSRDLAGADAQIHWSDLVENRLHLIPAQFRDARIVVSNEIIEAVERIQYLARLVSDVVRPSFVHGDLHLPNVIVADCKLAAIVDFEYARMWDPIGDFAKLELLEFDDLEGAREYFITEYQRIQGVPQHFELRLRVALGLELVSAVPFFHRWGDREALAGYRSRLARWLEEPDTK